MIGSLITRGLSLIFGYAYPAYECYKTVEMNKPGIDQLRFWCQYWILVAVITVCERIGDTFVGWVPMYGEAKLAFFIYLWYPKTKGTSYVYDSFFKPYMAKHETEIDRNLLEIRTRASDMLVSYWLKAATYGQSRIFEILQYVASQSAPPQPSQPQQPSNRLQTTTTPSISRSEAATQPQPTSPSSSNKSSEEEADDDDVDYVMEEAEPSDNSKSAKIPKTTSEEQQHGTGSKTTSKASTSSSEEEGFVQVDKVASTTDESAQASVEAAKDILMEIAAVRVTRARLRKARASSSSVQTLL